MNAHLNKISTFLSQVKVFSNNPGINFSQIKGNKPKILKMVLYSLIELKCFSNFTWTGKGQSGKKTKNALKEYPQFLQLLYSVVKGSDNSYDYDLFLRHLKDKAIKYAYE